MTSAPEKSTRYGSLRREFIWQDEEGSSTLLSSDFGMAPLTGKQGFTLHLAQLSSLQDTKTLSSAELMRRKCSFILPDKRQGGVGV